LALTPALPGTARQGKCARRCKCPKPAFGVPGGEGNYTPSFLASAG
jgi:hypothetical protein